MKYLVNDIGVAAVPGSSFYNDARDGAQQVRFAFCKRDETLDAAAETIAEVEEVKMLVSFGRTVEWFQHRDYLLATARGAVSFKNGKTPKKGRCPVAA